MRYGKGSMQRAMTWRQRRGTIEQCWLLYQILVFGFTLCSNAAFYMQFNDWQYAVGVDFGMTRLGCGASCCSWWCKMHYGNGQYAPDIVVSS
jgi:hypothetical protein